MLSIYGSTKLQPLVRRLRNWQRLRRRTKLGHVALRAPAPPQAVLILPKDDRVSHKSFSDNEKGGKTGSKANRDKEERGSKSTNEKIYQ